MGWCRMVTEKSNLFRKEALERSVFPERLDQLMRSQPSGHLCALGSLVAVGHVGIMGQVPLRLRVRCSSIQPK